MKELQHAVSLQKNKKAPGEDKIDGYILKNLLHHFPTFLKKIYTTCLSFAHFPALWKRGIAIFFRKHNKDKTDPRGYRPVVLLSAMGKVLERIIKYRIISHLEHFNLLDDAQHGFRESHSTITAMSSFKSIIQKILSSHVYCAAISLDIQGAFDELAWSIISRIIDNSNLHIYLKYIIKNYISVRKISFRFARGLLWFDVWKGCPQGSCLGPLLWIIVANDLLKNYHAHYSDIVSYADDFVIFSGAGTRLALERDIASKLDFFNILCHRLNLQLNTSKCQAMLFGPNTMDRRRSIFRLGREKVKVTDTITYLGFTLDARFTWLDHFSNIRNNLHNLTKRISRVSTRDVGVKPAILKIWYNTIIEKKISYGYETWLPDLKTPAIKRLSSCQRLGLLSVVRSYKSVSTEALCVLAGIPPIYLKLKNSFAVFNTLQSNGSYIINDITYHGSSFMKKIPSFHSPFLHSSNNIHFVSPILKEPSSSEDLSIYTDGSKMPEGMSAAFTVCTRGSFSYDFSIRLSKNNSVFQAEIYAIYRALQWSLNSGFTHIFIYTDSLSSILSLKRFIPLMPLVHDIFILAANNPHLNFYFGWVKAHVGISGNERADALAKSAIERNKYDDRVSDIPLPQSFLKKHSKTILQQQWQNQWSNSDVGRHTYLIKNLAESDYVCGSRVQAYFISGHGSFPAFLQKIGKRPSDRCTCGRKGDAFHYLFERCTLIQENFKYITKRTPESNMKLILIDSVNYQKLCRIYNVLNENFSFIRYKF